MRNWCLIKRISFVLKVNIWCQWANSSWSESILTVAESQLKRESHELSVLLDFLHLNNQWNYKGYSLSECHHHHHHHLWSLHIIKCICLYIQVKKKHLLNLKGHDYIRKSIHFCKIRKFKIEHKFYSTHFSNEEIFIATSEKHLD